MRLGMEGGPVGGETPRRTRRQRMASSVTASRVTQNVFCRKRPVCTLKTTSAGVTSRPGSNLPRRTLPFCNCHSHSPSLCQTRRRTEVGDHSRARVAICQLVRTVRQNIVAVFAAQGIPLASTAKMANAQAAASIAAKPREAVNVRSMAGGKRSDDTTQFGGWCRPPQYPVKNVRIRLLKQLCIRLALLVRSLRITCIEVTLEQQIQFTLAAAGTQPDEAGWLAVPDFIPICCRAHVECTSAFPLGQVLLDIRDGLARIEMFRAG